jgi:hypothetical protein
LTTAVPSPHLRQSSECCTIMSPPSALCMQMEDCGTCAKRCPRQAASTMWSPSHRSLHSQGAAARPSASVLQARTCPGLPGAPISNATPAGTQHTAAPSVSAQSTTEPSVTPAGCCSRAYCRSVQLWQARAVSTANWLPAPASGAAASGWGVHSSTRSGWIRRRPSCRRSQCCTAGCLCGAAASAPPHSSRASGGIHSATRCWHSAGAHATAAAAAAATAAAASPATIRAAAGSTAAAAGAAAVHLGRPTAAAAVRSCRETASTAATVCAAASGAAPSESAAASIPAAVAAASVPASAVRGPASCHRRCPGCSQAALRRPRPGAKEASQGSPKLCPPPTWQRHTHAYTLMHPHACAGRSPQQAAIPAGEWGCSCAGRRRRRRHNSSAGAQAFACTTAQQHTPVKAPRRAQILLCASVGTLL